MLMIVIRGGKNREKNKNKIKKTPTPGETTNEYDDFVAFVVLLK